ncbi:MAG: phosphate transporter permease subunit PstC [Frankiales bacterium]|nr:phosphate transporter permease subunit PstC [Frankiales bacterium]
MRPLIGLADVADDHPDSDVDEDDPRPLESALGRDDRVFRGLLRTGGLTVLTIMVLVGVFLLYKGGSALRSAGWSFFSVSSWQPDAGHGHFGIAGVLLGTVLIALVAICIAVPLATGTALYISEYAPRRLKQTLISLVDLMAAVPSVVYGLWGFFLLQPDVLVHGAEGKGLPRWLATYFGWVPFLKVDGYQPRDPLATPTVLTSSTLIAGVVVAMMVTPIICSIMREVFSQAPVGEREGAFALGATRWGMIRSVVLPFGKGGMIGGAMLGLGRAMGETIAVYMIISPLYAIQPHILQSGASSVSALIALQYGAATPFGTSALMAAGLALFLLTLVVNFGASAIVARSRSGAATG